MQKHHQKQEYMPLGRTPCNVFGLLQFLYCMYCFHKSGGFHVHNFRIPMEWPMTYKEKYHGSNTVLQL